MTQYVSDGVSYEKDNNKRSRTHDVCGGTGDQDDDSARKDSRSDMLRTEMPADIHPDG